jgi:hypothetical protein
MKTLLISFIFCFVLSFSGIAQNAIVISEGPIAFRHGNTPGITMSIPEVSFKKIQDSWIKTLEKGTKSKVMNENSEISIFGAILKDISEAPVNIYSLVRDNDSAVLMSVAVELKKDEYVSSDKNAEEFAKVKTFLVEFAKGHYLELAEGQLANEEKKLSKLESDLKSLENDKVKLEKMIQSNTSDIGSTKDELILLRTNLTSLNEELLAQTNQYNALEEGTAKDEKKKYVDDLEKRVKKTSKDVESGEKKIINMQAEIDKAQNDKLPANVKEQEQLRKEIESQSEVVRMAKDKVARINGSI